MFFKTLEIALYCLNFPEKTSCLTIVQCDESYEYFTQNDRILFCIGQGPKRSHGHPSGNQHYLNQHLLHGPSSLQELYPVFRIFSNCAEYMGNYAILGWRKRISFEGFSYYEYKLCRKYKNRIAQLPLELTDMIDVETTAKNIDETSPVPPSAKVKNP